MRGRSNGVLSEKKYAALKHARIACGKEEEDSLSGFFRQEFQFAVSFKAVLALSQTDSR